MNALIVVDIQNDFLPGGSLEVKEGDHILPLVNEIIHYPFDLIVATKDWHPSDHSSFAPNHAGKKPGEEIMVAGVKQILWPIHCEHGTWGAEFAQGWDHTLVDKVFYKGTNPLIDSYSAFFDNGHRQSTGLEVYLRDKGVDKIFFVGLATDYCVKFSVFDALQLGFQCYVIVDACRGVNLHPRDSEEALQQMQKGGAILLSFKDLKEILINVRTKHEEL